MACQQELKAQVKYSMPQSITIDMHDQKTKMIEVIVVASFCWSSMSGKT